MKKRLLPVAALVLIAVMLCSCGSAEKAEQSSTYTAFTAQTQTVVTETATSVYTETSAREASTEIFETEPKTTESQTSVTQTTVTQTSAVQTTTRFVSAQTTLPQTAEQKTTETAAQTRLEEKSVNTCTLSIDCRNALKNLEQLKKGKRQFVPESGYILKDVSVEVKDGETAFDVLKRACRENVCTDSCDFCKKNGVQLEFSYTPAYGSYYVEGIHQLYEKDCGTLSGWMFSVNGKYPDVASSAYEVKSADVITFAYTASMGDDLP